MSVNKPHLEFHALDMTTGWQTPEGYPAGIEQKILAGALDESGQFTLSTYGSRDGAPTGEYFVTVEWWQARQTKLRDGDDSPPINRLPARYADAHGSKLRVQVTEGTNELQPFRLTR